MDPSSCSKQRSLRKIARVLRVDIRGSDDSLADQIAERITGIGGLLVIDEAQHLVAGAVDLGSNERNLWHCDYWQ